MRRSSDRAAGRPPVWQSIAATLEEEIAAGHYGPGDKLPTEAALASRFGVNRHTVRHALAALAERGLTLSRRGAGVFVRHAPTEYPIGRRVRFHRAIAATGRLPGRQVLRLETRPADADEAARLEIAPGAPVVVTEGVSLADAVPIAHFLSIFPAERLPGMAEALAEISSVTEALGRAGVTDYTRRETRLSATRASATQARHLKLAEGDPVLSSEQVSIDPAGRPVEYGQTVFAGDRVTLILAPDAPEADAP
ncbi:phosphonate metabolism transcriptional regulator PhnF [Acidimangrovimonas sediminis]|uniref:phosphonate metabolism transcriptional regulator PhnF n=1 Tax=Acidimangrovimonas sediminis TaxID=2056283 RepID=UPI000C809EBF|nr:phosphonate metabolism transcriptional regulator PhnF [Acidimangrovimonas sediminis]